MTSTLLVLFGFVAALLAVLIAISIRGVTTRRKPAEPAESKMEHTASPTATPRLLVALDGSASSFQTVAEVSARPWPRGSDIEIVTVIHSAVPSFPDPAFSLVAAHVEDEERQVQAAPALLQAAVDRLRVSTPGSRVTSKILYGDPAHAIVEEAKAIRADEIFVGCHGHGRLRREVLGSVCQHVAAHADCSVHIVKAPREAGEVAA